MSIHERVIALRRHLLSPDLDLDLPMDEYLTPTVRQAIKMLWICNMEQELNKLLLVSERDYSSANDHLDEIIVATSKVTRDPSILVLWTRF